MSDLVGAWCVAVEFPVVVRDAGDETIIRSSPLIDKTVLAPSRVDPEARFLLRTFDIGLGGVEGQVAIVAWQDAKGEGWCDCWSRETDRSGRRLDQLPTLNRGFVALHGVWAADAPKERELGSFSAVPWIIRCDVRSGAATVPLARSIQLDSPRSIRRSHADGDRTPNAVQLAGNAADKSIRAAVEHHFATSQRANGPVAIYYVGDVLSALPFTMTWRDHVPGTVVTWQEGRRVDISVAALLELEEIVVAAWERPPTSRQFASAADAPMGRHPRESSCEVPVVSISDTPAFVHSRLAAKLAKMNLIEAETNEDLRFFHFSATSSNPEFSRIHGKYERLGGWIGNVNLGGEASRILVIARFTGSLRILDRDHPVIRWFCMLREHVNEGLRAIEPEEVEMIGDKITDTEYEMDEILRRWSKSETVPLKLKPPESNEGKPVDFEYDELLSRRTVRQVSD